MRAFYLTDHDAPPRVANIAVPEPAEGEVRVRIAACGLNFADLLMQKGTYQDTPALPFVLGMEVANAYTELNDPDLQEELFKTQLEGQEEEDSMAKMDHDFVRALRYAMPPAGGLGVGIDRLVMLLTGKKSIRDVVLFPLLRPEV